MSAKIGVIKPPLSEKIEHNPALSGKPQIVIHPPNINQYLLILGEWFNFYRRGWFISPDLCTKNKKPAKGWFLL